MHEPALSHPFYGVGVEWTESLETAMLEHPGEIDCLELIPDNFFWGRRREFLDRLGASGIPALIHGVELSLGTAEPLKQSHLDRMKEIADRVNTINISDHLAMTEGGGVEIGQLTPLSWSEENCDIVCRKIDQIQSRISVPFLIENIAHRFVYPDTELTETDFINRILRRTGCYLLLDLHNLHANAYNFRFDPFEWLDRLEMGGVGGIHLAGGFFDGDGTLVDGHCDLVPDRVWDLYRYVCDRIRPACTIVEWTEAPPPYETLLGDVKKAQAVLGERAVTKRQRAARPSSFLREVAP